MKGTNYILPKAHRQGGTQFDAVVDGKPTGLAGCTRTDCDRAGLCLRAADGLTYRVDMARGQRPEACGVFILKSEA